jgi:hypothetical protein
MDEPRRLCAFEEQFHRQLQSQAYRLTGKVLPASRLKIEPLPDGVEHVRAALERLGKFDRGLLWQLPGTQAVQLRFFRGPFRLFSRVVARVRAQVLTPVEQVVRGQPVGPVGREQLLDALARYELLPASERPTIAIFASAGGFTPDARAAALAHFHPAVILMAPRPDGGWETLVPEPLRRSAWARLVEFESEDDLQRRLQYHLEQNAGRLDSRGIPVSELADLLGLSAGQTETLVRQACRQNPRLMTLVLDGRLHVCRSPLGEVDHKMSIWNRVRKLLGLKPTTTERVRMLTAQRIALEQQRQQVDAQLRRLEAEEAEALAQGAAATSQAEKRQIAGRLLRRVRAQVQVYSQQIDILGTHIHNLTLAEQGRRIELPSPEELTRQAAEAEQVIKELAASADLASSIEAAATSPLQAEEEAAILAEFDQIASRATAAAPSAAEKPTAARVPEVPRKESAGPETG